MKLFLILMFAISSTLVMGQQEDYITVSGDSLVGRSVNGESIREVYGNVTLKQGDVVITCQKAIQFISRNDAELIGNVVAIQDSLTIETPHAFYFGNKRTAQSTSGIRLNDKKVILTANEGDYYFNEDRADFRINVTLFDTVSTLTSDELIYYKTEDRMIAINNVKIIDPENIIRADSLEYFRLERVTIADNNVSIRNFVNNIVIYGNHLEDYAKDYYTLIDENPLLIQVDTSYSRNDSISAENPDSVIIRLDTLMIASLKMQSYRDTLNVFYARDSVEIWRGTFSSKNNYTVYFRNEDKIVTRKVPYAESKPIIWFENSQITGDSINIFIRENKIKFLEIIKNAFLLSSNPEFMNRYDQISGEKIHIYFNEGIIDRTEIFGGLLSIYYMYEGSEANGLIKSSANSGRISFEDKKVNVVSLFESPANEYYPENQVMGKELSFTLPHFVIFTDRPTKYSIISERRNLIRLGKE